MKKLYITVVNFRSRHDVRRLLDILDRQTGDVREISVRVVVVDNSSELKPPDVRCLHLKTELLLNRENEGFARGANRGARYALNKGADRVLFLNPDIIPPPDFLKKIIYSGYDITGAVLAFERNGKMIYDTGGMVNFMTGMTYHREAEKRKDIPGFLSSGRISYVSGCVMMVDKKVFAGSGFFDENFFLYYEDADYCLRASKKQFSIGITADVVAEHELREGKCKSREKNMFLLKSKLLFIRKWVPLSFRLLAYLDYFILLWKMKLREIISF